MRSPLSSKLLLAAFLGTLAACSDSGGGSSGPRFTTTPTTTTVVLENYSYAALVSGFSQTPTFSLTSAPAGMSVDTQGVVSWMPSWSQLGSETVRLQASFSGAVIEQSWDLRVHQDVLMGVTYSPRGHTSSSTNDDVIEFFSGNDTWGRVIGYHSSWRESVAAAGEIPGLPLFALAARDSYGTEPVLGLGWADGEGLADLSSQSEPSNNTWTNQETRDEFRAMVVDLATTYQPTHLFLGNEVNSWYVQDPDQWDDWMTQLAACYDAIKAVSPDTIVFTVFQLERMKGLGAGTTGWSDPPHWELVDDVAASGKVDALGFTSYPYFEYDLPEEIPADYYQEIAAHWSGPVIFTEIGWPATASFPFPGGIAAQEAFVDVFFERTEGLELEYVMWLFLHDWDDQASVPGFIDIGLRNNDGTLLRPSDAVWSAAATDRERP